MTSPSPAQHADYLRRLHFGSLDGVRCVAIVAVIWHHSHVSPGEFLTRGFLGVDLFFVLSGFLIVTLLLREKDTRGTISLRSFYVRRSLRIFPLYYGLLAALAALYVLRPSTDTGNTFFSELPLYLTYTSNWTHTVTAGLAITWSLAAEEQFYLAWPTIERYLPRRATWLALAAALCVNQAINFGLLDDVWRRTFHTEPDLEILDSTFTPILLGVLLAHVLHTPRGFATIAATLRPRWTSAAVAVALVTFIAASPGDISGSPRLVIQLLMTCWLASMVVREDHVLHGSLTFAPIARMGAISYGMYLLHNIGIYIATKLVTLAPALDFLEAKFVLGLLFTVVLAELSFRCYEQPLLRLKRRFAWRPASID